LGTPAVEASRAARTPLDPDALNLCSPPQRPEQREKPASITTSLFDREGKAASSAITVSNLQRTMASDTHLHHHRRRPEHRSSELPFGMTPEHDGITPTGQNANKATTKPRSTLPL
jgi:hypothetical protein